jgi:hypothetical protein
MAKPTPISGLLQNPIVDKNGAPTIFMNRWLQKIETMASTSLTVLGINPNAPIAGTTSTPAALNSKTQNLSAEGTLPTSSLVGSVNGTQVGFTLDSVPDGTTRFAIVNAGSLNGVALVDAANLALINFADATHQNKILDNINDGNIYQRFTRVASGQVALPTGSIASGSSATATATAVGVLATDAVEWAFASAPATGYASLSIIAYVTPGNVNFQIGNPSGGGITPGAQTLNYVVIR